MLLAFTKGSTQRRRDAEGRKLIRARLPAQISLRLRVSALSCCSSVAGILKHYAALLLACVVVLITGCAHQSVPDDPGASKPLKVRYACASGEGLVAEFAVDRASVRVVPVNGTAIVLPIQPSGSGFRYADARHEFRGKGAEAMWTIGRRAPLRCRVVP